MRIRRLRLAGFGAAGHSALLDLRLAAGAGAAELELAADIVAEAVAWALHGSGSAGSGEVEVELVHGGSAWRVRRAASDGAAANVTVWQADADDEDPDAGEPAASGDSELAALRARLGWPDAATTVLGLAVPAGKLAALLGDGPALAEALRPPLAREAGRTVEDALEHLLVEVESRADVLRLERAEALEAAAGRMREDSASELSLEALDERLEEVRLRGEAAAAGTKELSEAAARTEALLETAQARQRRLEELERARERLRAAERREPELKQLERELARAEAASRLAPQETELSDPKSIRAEAAAARALREAESACARASEEAGAASDVLRRARQDQATLAGLRARARELEDLRGVLDLLERKRASLAASEAELETQRSRRAEAASLLADLEARRSAARSSCERARAALGDEGARRLAELRGEAAEARSRLAAVRRLEAAQSRRREVTKTHATTMIHLERVRRTLDAERRQLERRLTGEARVETAELEGQRARVAELSVDERRLESELGEQDAAVQELGAEVLGLRQELGSLAYSDAEELSRETAALERRLAQEGEPAELLANAEAQLRELDGEAATTAAALEAAESELVGARAREESERDLVRELETRVPEALRGSGRLETERASLLKRCEEVEGGLAEAVRADAEAGERLAAARAELEPARRAHDAAAAGLDSANAALGRLVGKEGFLDLADFREAKRSTKERTLLSARVGELRGELDAAREAHRELEGLTNVPVLRDSDRAEFEAEEWERRQRERKERLQADRVLRDRELLAGLLARLREAEEESRRDEDRLGEARAALERVSQATSAFTEDLRGLRERHAALSRLAELAGGRAGAAGGFGGFLEDALAAEALARAGQWCREISGGALHLAPAVEEASGLELREVHGPRRQAAAEAPPEERWLAGLALALGRADAILALAGAERPATVVIDALPAGLDEAAGLRVQAWLERLAATGRDARVGAAGSEEGGGEAAEASERAASGRAV